jgi:protein gp37
MTHRLESMGQSEKYGGLTVLNNRRERHFNGQVRTHEDALEIPLRRRKPTMYFVNSMSDLFHKGVPFEFIDKCFAVMALCPQHTFQILTKRPERMAEYLKHGVESDDWRFVSIAEQMWKMRPSLLESQHDGEMENHAWPLPNVWLGTSCENQQTADERIPHLLRCSAAVRFLSCEPLIGPIELRLIDVSPAGDGVRRTMNCLANDLHHRISWVIVGGESGKGARPCDIAWIRSIVKQCADAGVPCFVKQLGAKPFVGDGKWNKVVDIGYEAVRDDGGPLVSIPYMNLKDHKGGDINEWPADLRVRQFPTAAAPQEREA